MEQIINIANFILDSFIHIWPYLLISIPLAVAVKLSGASKYIKKALSKHPMVSIFLATVVGAFSPFCSCGVIPVITSLLLSGVPLAPVMSFWIASPSMDPEIYFLSVATVGWNLSTWRLVATFVISLSAGYITHFAMKKGYLGKEVLKLEEAQTTPSTPSISIFQRIEALLDRIKLFPAVSLATFGSPREKAIPTESNPTPVSQNTAPITCGCKSKKKASQWSFDKILNETWKATALVVKFMALAFFINALISFYVPQQFISDLLGGTGSLSVIIATLVGVPAYTSNLTALPLVGGLITLGMNQGAALSFLIAGPTTTLPAMIAVWGIASKRVFALYLSFSLIGAIVFGMLFNWFG